MDKKLIFLLIFAFACTKDKIHPKNERVTISNANPIQFWLTGEESFNQKVECGIYSTCFSQPANCNDSIRTQFIDDDITKDYDLVVVNKSGSVLKTTAFIKNKRYKYTSSYSLPQFSNNLFSAALTPWSNNSGCTDAAWAWQFANSIKSDGTSGSKRFSCFLYQAINPNYYKYPPGTYSVYFAGSNNSTGPNAGESILYFYGSNNAFSTSTVFINSGNIATGAFTKTLTFTTTDYYDDFGFEFHIGPPGNVQIISLNEVSITAYPSTGYIYDFTIFDLNFSLTSITPSVCESEIQFQIRDHSNGNIVAYSDSIYVSDNELDCTSLIQYSNSTNFAGLDFADESPSPLNFSLRIPSVFFEENFPQEQEDLELSDDTIITLWSKIEGKKLLDIGFMPFYMHKKVQMVLMMDNVSIDGVEYRMRDPYQITAPASKRSALRRASVLLSEKDFINRNLL